MMLVRVRMKVKVKGWGIDIEESCVSQGFSQLSRYRWADYNKLDEKVFTYLFN